MDESRWVEVTVSKAKVQTGSSEGDPYSLPPPSALLDTKPMSHVRCVMCSLAIGTDSEDVRPEAHRLTSNSEPWVWT